MQDGEERRFMGRICNVMAYHDASGHWLVAVYGVCGGNSRQGGDLDTSAGVADNDDDLPIPMSLLAESNDEVADDHDDHVRDHSGQSHLGLADTPVPTSAEGGDPITERTIRYKTDDGADEDGEVVEADGLRVLVVGRDGEDLGLGEVDGQVAGGGPADDEGGEFDDGEGEELPGDPEVEEDGLERVGVALEELPLLLGGRAAVEVRVTSGRCGMAEIGEVGQDAAFRLGFLKIASLSRGFHAFNVVDLLVGGWGGRGVGDQFGGVHAVPFRLWEAEDAHEQDSGEQGGIEPPEIPPSDVQCHGSGNDGANLDTIRCVLISISGQRTLLTISEPK